MTNKHKQLRIAVIPVVRIKTKLKVCLVTSREQRKWIIPTGKKEKNLSDRKVAALEAFEEAGILGKLDKNFRVQVSQLSHSGKYERKITVYLLHVKRILKRWPEIDERKRKHVSVKAYLKSVSNVKLKRKLSKAGVKPGGVSCC
jgi:8-oxo-dGTP pyrophosphatase MutT (NUDIX family)